MKSADYNEIYTYVNRETSWNVSITKDHLARKIIPIFKVINVGYLGYLNLG